MEEDLIKVNKLSTIYIVGLANVVMILYVISYKFIWLEHYYQNTLQLEMQHNLIKTFLIDKNDITTILSNKSIPNLITTIRDRVKNHTFVSRYNMTIDSSSDNDLPYISIREILDTLSGQLFKYSISINNELIVCNGLIDSSPSITKQYPINQDLVYNVSLQIDSKSSSEKQAILRINNQIAHLKKLFIVLFLLGTAIQLYIFNKIKRDKKRIKELHNDANSALTFYKVNSKYTVKCHQYFKGLFKSSTIANIANYITINYKADPLPLLVLPPEEECTRINQEKLDEII